MYGKSKPGVVPIKKGTPYIKTSQLGQDLTGSSINGKCYTTKETPKYLHLDDPIINFK